MRIASVIMPMFSASIQRIAVRLAMASMIMRSALSAIPMDSIFIPVASALALV